MQFMLCFSELANHGGKAQVYRFVLRPKGGDYSTCPGEEVVAIRNRHLIWPLSVGYSQDCEVKTNRNEGGKRKHTVFHGIDAASRLVAALE